MGKFLENYHSRKTYVVVRLITNTLFALLFAALLISTCKDSGFEEWGVRMLLLALFILLFCVFKKYLEKYLEKYIEKFFVKKGDKRSLLTILIVCAYIVFFLIFFVLLNGFHNSIFQTIEPGHDTFNIFPCIVALFIVIWISFDNIVDSFFVSSYKIVDNMESLPKFIKGKKTLVQYNLSKDIAPSEAGLLMYHKSDISNLLCIIYKWANENVVKIYTENGKKYMKVIGFLGDNVPGYERIFFQDVFHGKFGPAKFDKNTLKCYKTNINDLIFEYCITKGYCTINTSRVRSVIKPAAISLLCVVIGVYLVELIAFFVFFLWWVGFLFLIPYLIVHLSSKNYSFVLTDKGNKLMADIVGFKYFLEHCEEDQINKDLESDLSYNKNLPYVIALKLNWKVIDKLF